MARPGRALLYLAFRCVYWSVSLSLLFSFFRINFRSSVSNVHIVVCMNCHTKVSIIKERNHYSRTAQLHTSDENTLHFIANETNM